MVRVSTRPAPFWASGCRLPSNAAQQGTGGSLSSWEAQDARREGKGERRRGAGKSRSTSKGGAAQAGGEGQCSPLGPASSSAQRRGATPVEELVPRVVLKAEQELTEHEQQGKARAGVERWVLTSS